MYKAPNLVPSNSKNKNKNNLTSLVLWDSPHTSGAVTRMLKDVRGAGRITDCVRKEEVYN